MNPILVIGSPRSGTSVVAGVLHHLGVDMGKFYIRPDTQNPTGYFEDADIVKNDMNSYDNDREKWGVRFMELTKDRRDPWGFKTPTLCVTIKDVRENLEKRGFIPRYIYVKRNLENNIKALEKHHGRDDAREQIILQQENIKANLPTKGTFIIDYEALVGDPIKTLREVVEFLGIYPTQREQTKAVLHVIQSPPVKGDRVIAVASNLYR